MSSLTLGESSSVSGVLQVQSGEGGGGWAPTRSFNSFPCLQVPNALQNSGHTHKCILIQTFWTCPLTAPSHVYFQSTPICNHRASFLTLKVMSSSIGLILTLMGKTHQKFKSSNTDLSFIRHSLLISRPCGLEPHSTPRSLLSWAGRCYQLYLLASGHHQN